METAELKTTLENGVSSNLDATKQKTNNTELNTATTLNNNNSSNCDTSVNMLDSPKTKKQRQALKLRHAENTNSNSNSSTAPTAYNNEGAGGMGSLAMTVSNDNAVSADDLCKESTTTTTTSTTTTTTTISTIGQEQAPLCPLSPDSNSRSSSSSSSSSSCSNSSHSSCASKTHKSELSAATIISKEAAEPIMSENIKTTVATTVAATTASSLPSQSPDKLSFEEVENKLEEMFAGIEDEPPEVTAAGESITKTTVQNAETGNDLNLALQLAINSNSPPALNETNACKPVLVEEPKPTMAIVPMPTKASKKSTPPIITPPPIVAAVVATATETVEATTKTITTTIATTNAITTTCTVSLITTATTTITTELITTTTTTTATTAAKTTTTTTTLPAITAIQTIPTPLGKRIRTPRRLSVGIAAENIRISLEAENAQPFDPSKYLKNLKNTPTKQQKSKSEDNRIKINNNNNNNNKSVDVKIDDEVPSTSAAAAAALAARAAGADKEDHEQDQDVEEEEDEGEGEETRETTKVLPKNKKNVGGGRKRKAAAKGKAKGGTGSGGGGSNVASRQAAGKIPVKNKRQQQQQKSSRRRRNSTDEEEGGSSMRDSCTANLGSESKYRSPFILVKRDGSVSVINAPTSEDAGSEKAGAKGKKAPAAKYAHDRKIRGLHSSTLSTKYDAETADSSWICVFCKRGPHKVGLGDLFGPYVISSDCEEYRTAMRLPGVVDIDSMFAAKRKRTDMVQTQPRNLPVVPAAYVQQQTQIQISPTTSSGGRGKKKRKSSANEPEFIMPANVSKDSLNTSTSSSEFVELGEMFLGMTKVTGNNYEVWVHEDCAVWAPDVFLVGASVTGLDATVWNSTRYRCQLCAQTGATVCCLQRDCKSSAHAPCARQSGWSLDEACMRVHCRQHIQHDFQEIKKLGFIADSLYYMHMAQTNANVMENFPLPAP